MALKKFTKDDIADILKRILDQKTIADVNSEINDIADEYNVDISEPDPIDDSEKEPTAEDLEEDFQESVSDWDLDDDY